MNSPITIGKHPTLENLLKRLKRKNTYHKVSVLKNSVSERKRKEYNTPQKVIINKDCKPNLVVIPSTPSKKLLNDRSLKISKFLKMNNNSLNQSKVRRSSGNIRK